MKTPRAKSRPSRGRLSKGANPKRVQKNRKAKSTPNGIDRATAQRLMDADLKRSGLIRADGAARGFKLLTPAQTKAKTKTDKYAGSYAWSYLIPYYDINGKIIKDYWRVRYLEDVLGPFGSKPEKPWRYTGPERGRLRLYFDPTFDWSPIKVAKCHS